MGRERLTYSQARRTKENKDFITTLNKSIADNILSQEEAAELTQKYWKIKGGMLAITKEELLGLAYALNKSQENLPITLRQTLNQMIQRSKGSLEIKPIEVIQEQSKESEGQLGEITQKEDNLVEHEEKSHQEDDFVEMDEEIVEEQGGDLETPILYEEITLFDIDKYKKIYEFFKSTLSDLEGYSREDAGFAAYFGDYIVEGFQKVGFTESKSGRQIYTQTYGNIKNQASDAWFKIYKEIETRDPYFLLSDDFKKLQSDFCALLGQDFEGLSFLQAGETTAIYTGNIISGLSVGAWEGISGAVEFTGKMIGILTAAGLDSSARKLFVQDIEYVFSQLTWENTKLAYQFLMERFDEIGQLPDNEKAYEISKIIGELGVFLLIPGGVAKVGKSFSSVGGEVIQVTKTTGKKVSQNSQKVLGDIQKSIKESKKAKKQKPTEKTSTTNNIHEKPLSKETKRSKASQEKPIDVKKTNTSQVKPKQEAKKTTQTQRPQRKEVIGKKVLDGVIQEGRFNEKGLLHGINGKKTYTKGEIAFEVGEFEQGILREGTKVMKNGDRMEGLFFNNLFEGNKTFGKSDFLVSERGSFLSGKLDGDGGVRIYLNGLEERGRFVQGKLIDGEAINPKNGRKLFYKNGEQVKMSDTLADINSKIAEIDRLIFQNNYFDKMSKTYQGNENVFFRKMASFYHPDRAPKGKNIQYSHAMQELNRIRTESRKTTEVFSQYSQKRSYFFEELKSSSIDFSDFMKTNPL